MNSSDLQQLSVATEYQRLQGDEKFQNLCLNSQKGLRIESQIIKTLQGDGSYHSNQPKFKVN